MYSYILCYLALLFFIGNISAENVELTIPSGTLIGEKLTTPEGIPYFSFQRVPYAEPPIGKLRFMSPVPIRNSTKVYNNTNGDIICYQTQFDIPTDYANMESEDCLFVNVYSPQLPSDRTNPSLPVLVYFFGGGFIVGYPHKKHLGPDFIIEEDVIVVIVNYRVGAFGFLSTQDTVVPGNAGLKDQVLALQWVKQNIRYFGGDASKVTIGGESAGGSSAIYLMLNQKTKGLYRAAIAESGSALSQWSYQTNARNIAFQLAKRIDPNFTSTDSETLLSFLESLPAETIKNVSTAMSDEKGMNTQLFTEFMFSPVIEVDHEDAFLTDNQYELLTRGDFNRVPSIVGIASEEAILIAMDSQLLTRVSQLFDQNPEKLVPIHMNLTSESNPKQVGQEIKKIYTDGNFVDHPGAMTRCFSDTTANKPLIKTAELLSQWTEVYFYQFSYAGTMTPFPPFVIPGAERVPHVGEHSYWWTQTERGFDNTDIWKFTDADRLTKKRLVKMFTNFIKNVNPSMTEDGKEITWPTTRSQGNENFLYMNINVTLDILNHPKDNTYSKWIAIYDKYAERPFTTF